MGITIRPPAPKPVKPARYVPDPQWGYAYKDEYAWHIPRDWQRSSKEKPSMEIGDRSYVRLSAAIAREHPNPQVYLKTVARNLQMHGYALPGQLWEIRILQGSFGVPMIVADDERQANRIILSKLPDPPSTDVVIF